MRIGNEEPIQRCRQPNTLDIDPQGDDSVIRVRRRVLPGIHYPFGGAGQGVAGVCPTGVRVLPQMRPS